VSNSPGDWIGFAFGEELDTTGQRSLGYRLLTPAHGEPWCTEVESLARQLQAAPYPDHWPGTDLFCSVLLAEGRRAVAVARYGVADHTIGQRRGGLELLGVVGPASLEIPNALAIYHWLQQRRGTISDLRQFGGPHALSDILTAAPPSSSASAPLPVLPVRLWQEGVLLFAANSPTDPDQHLGLLEQATGAAWQWLPLVGPDFPLQTYAQRGPLLAWTPPWAGIAVKLDRRPPEPRPPRSPRRARSSLWIPGLLTLLLAGLLGANLWSTLALHHRLSTMTPVEPPVVRETNPLPVLKPSEASDRERFVTALNKLLTDQGSSHEWDVEHKALLARYDRLVSNRKDLRVDPADLKGKLTVAAISVLAERNVGHIEETVRKALADKGFSDRLIKAACDHVREQFAGEIKDKP
jgi:hypothetical protein